MTLLVLKNNLKYKKNLALERLPKFHKKFNQNSFFILLNSSTTKGTISLHFINRHAIEINSHTNTHTHVTQNDRSKSLGCLSSI